MAGQSNAVGAGTNIQPWSNANYVATMFDSGGHWIYLSDTNTGSAWPKTATDYMTTRAAPFNLVQCAVSGSGITDWQKGQANYTALLSRMAAAGGVSAVLFWQGENEVSIGQSQATYQGYLNQLADDLFADTGAKLMPCKLQNCTGWSAGANAEIRNAVAAVWAGNSHVLQGPNLSDLDSDDTAHLKTDGKLTTAGARWAVAILAAGL